MRRRVLSFASSGSLLLVLTTLGCGSAAGDSAGTGAPRGNSNDNGSMSGGGSSNGSSSAGSGTAPGGIPGSPNIGAGGGGGSGGAPIIVVPPEKELEASFLAPVTTGKYVFSANPGSGRVAVIDAATYAVQLFNAGFAPTYLTAIPHDRGALVINAQSHDVTWFEVSGEKVSLVDATLPVHADANAWATSPDGRFAIAWTSTPDDQMLDPTAGSQTVTVLDLEKRSAKQLTVGFHPTRVVVDEQSRRAFVVSDNGVSTIELGEESETTLLAAVSEDPLEDAGTRDVSILPDGSFAIVRIEGSSKLRVVDLSVEDSLVAYDLGAPITDLDLSKDGKLALAAVPGIGEVVIMNMPPTAGAGAFEHVKIPGEITSSISLSDASELALLFQNGDDNSHLTMLDLREGRGRALHSVDLKGPVKAAFAAPGAASAITFQKPIVGSTKAGLFSGVPTLAKRSAKIVGTDAVPKALAFDEAGKYALVTVGDEKTPQRGVYRVRLDTMQEDFLELASPPAPGATGIVEGVGRGFVAQQHPEGRITFVDLDTARAHTITGFELAARILQ
jgi:DNA-binding beta-propeller fold protein YncE